jgi:hypothetical protein
MPEDRAAVADRWWRRAAELDEYAWQMSLAGDFAAADDAEASAEEYRVAIDEVECGRWEL